jgi:parallel beta-helix repeat protein
MHVFNITDQNNVTLEGFTITDASAAPSATKNDKVHSHAISALLLPPEYQRGSIRVTSKPSGAQIYLVTPDGPFVGRIPRTPYRFDKVSVGYSTITVYLEGYYDWSKKVLVQVDQTTYVEAQLKPKHKPTPPPPKTGAISVTSTPSGATIYVDTYLGWSHKGKTPNTITGVSPDYYTIKLTLAGYQDWTKKIHVAAGETARIHATLSQASGSISVTSTPSDALMYLDEFYSGKTPHTITAVSPGYHIIKLALADYQNWSKEVHVAAGETSCFDVKLTPILGSISVTSSPSDAKIYLDDRYRGKTPHRVAEVSSGNHTLRLTLDGYQDWSTDLQVRIGETSDVAAIMIPAFTQTGIYLNNASNCVIKNNKIINCGQRLLIVSGSNNIIEENIIRDDTIAGAGVRIESSATNTGIHENCFIDNVPQAWDDGRANNWIGNYWSQPPGGQGNYIIPGAAGSEDKDPLDECPL